MIHLQHIEHFNDAFLVVCEQLGSLRLEFSTLYK